MHDFALISIYIEEFRSNRRHTAILTFCEQFSPSLNVTLELDFIYIEITDETKWPNQIFYSHNAREAKRERERRGEDVMLLRCDLCDYAWILQHFPNNMKLSSCPTKLKLLFLFHSFVHTQMCAITQRPTELNWTIKKKKLSTELRQADKYDINLLSLTFRFTLFSQPVAYTYFIFFFLDSCCSVCWRSLS